MPKFTVNIPEHWDRVYTEVEADSPEAAIALVEQWELSGEGFAASEVEFVETITGRDVCISAWAEEENENA